MNISAQGAWKYRSSIIPMLTFPRATEVQNVDAKHILKYKVHSNLSSTLYVSGQDRQRLAAGNLGCADDQCVIGVIGVSSSLFICFDTNFPFVIDLPAFSIDVLRHQKTPAGSIGDYYG
jgi:hypothetical protein